MKTIDTLDLSSLNFYELINENFDLIIQSKYIINQGELIRVVTDSDLEGLFTHDLNARVDKRAVVEIDMHQLGDEEDGSVINYIVISRPNLDSKGLKIIYQDIVYDTSYYGDSISDWIQENEAYINRHFMKCIDDNINEEISKMEVPYKKVLDKISIYNTPYTKNLMAIKLVEAYSNTMNSMMKDIADKKVKTKLGNFIKGLKNIEDNKPGEAS